jgi:hypothetical protein
MKFLFLFMFSFTVGPTGVVHAGFAETRVYDPCRAYSKGKQK